MKYKYILSLLSFFVFCFLLFISFDFIKDIVNLFTQLLTSNEYTYIFIAFFSIVIIMMFWIVYFFINLRLSNKKLNCTLNELSFQKAALDEHAIVSMTDVKGNITYVNDKFCEISGYDYEELIGKNHRIVKSNEHSKEFFDDLKKTILSGNVWSGEVKNRKKDGSFYWVRATIMPFLDLDKKATKFVSIRTDITQLKNTQDELTKAKNIAMESNKIKSDFLANMSHELKTPLNSINIISSVMTKNRNQKLDEEQIKNLDIINNCGNHLLYLINDVLDISKLDAGNIKTISGDFDFKKFIYLIKEEYSNQMKEKNLQFTINYDDKITSIHNDELKIKQIIENLLSNAIKFTNKGEITLSVKDDNDYMIIEIKDDGIGIEESKLKDIFLRFKQVDESTSRKYTGTGLGLAISKELAHLLNGDIEVKSEVNKGSTFTLKFVKNSNVENKIVMKRKDTKTYETSSVKKDIQTNNLKETKILILNDNPVSLFNIFVELKRKAKKVTLINNLDDFIKNIDKNDYDKIIVNISDKIKINDTYLGTYAKDLYLICDEDYILNDNMKKQITKVFHRPIKKEIILAQIAK